MALIICSECGRQISDKAGSCPGCGCPISIAELTVSDGAQVNGTVKCRECGYTMPGDIEYCQNCGAELRDIYSGTDYNSSDKKSQSMASLIEEYKQQHTYEEVEEEKESVFSVLSLVFLLTAILLIFVNPLLSVIFGLPTIICLLISHLQKNRKATCSKVTQGIILLLIVIGCIFSFFDEMEPTKEDTYETARMQDTEVLDEIEKNNEQSELIKARENDDRGEEVNEKKKIKSNTEYQEVFYADLLANWDSYVGKWIITSFPYERYNEDERTINSDAPTDYDIYEYLTVYASNYEQLDSGEYITVNGVVCEETDFDYIIKEAEIIQIGNESIEKYLSGKGVYDEKLRIEAEEYEAKFKEESTIPSYDDLSRYPDTYEETKIKVTVKITEVKPDGIIFAGSYMAKMNDQKVIIYDEREVKEPKLLEGDNITIYGYGDGLTTIKLQETSGLIPKTVDKYTVPGINIKYVEFN